MELIKKDNIYYIETQGRCSKNPITEVSFLSVVKGWKPFVNHMINYCNGKEPSSKVTWLSKIFSVLKPLVSELELKKIPSNTKEWTQFIKDYYLLSLTSNTRKAKIATRVKDWNANVYPFLTFLQDRDYIPIDVVIPKMKSTDQYIKNSSFRVKFIGDKEAHTVNHKDHIDKLITPVSLSRTDAEYFDELYYDIERKRNKIHQCLVSYWKYIKSHYEYGCQLIESVDTEKVEERAKNNDFYDKRPTPGSGRRSHFACKSTEESFAILIYLNKTRTGCFTSGMTPLNGHKPFKESPGCATFRLKYRFYERLLPSGFLENEEYINEAAKINWMLGIIQNRDVSFICALLMMENPQFTFESLLYCKIVDKHGKTWLESNNGVFSFTLEKKRAKTFKRESLSDLSYDIISTLFKMRESYKDFIPTNIKNQLFITLAHNKRVKTPFTIPTSCKVAGFLSGSHSSIKSYRSNINTIFPSLDDIGLAKGMLTHSKLRSTEGILEFFRTGSVRAVSRKLGNTKKVALEHYLPKPLIAAYNTRQVRRFQNLLIVAATINEDYMLEAVDFNTIGELNNFIADMLDMDNKGSNPLVNYIKEQSDIELKRPTGDLISNVSEQSLTVLYTYKLIAESHNIDASSLAKKDIKTGLSPLAFITLSKHINGVLTRHSNAEHRKTNNHAQTQAKKLSKRVKWGELFINIERLS